jgi:hypothetical protein
VSAAARDRGGLHDLFVLKFGREPQLGDPIFFDPDADTPVAVDEKKLEAQMVITMIRAGTPHHLIYASFGPVCCSQKRSTSR